MAKSVLTLNKPLTDLQKAAAKAVGEGLDSFMSALQSQIPTSRKKTRRFLRKFHREHRRQGRAGVMFPARMRVDPEGTETKKIVDGIWKGVANSIESMVVRRMADAVRNQRPSFRIEIKHEG